MTGAFITALLKDKGQVKGNRIKDISLSVEKVFKRHIEDIEDLLVQCKTEREDCLDIFSDDADSLRAAKKFNAIAFSKNDLRLSLKKYDLELALTIAKKRYAYLCGSEE